MRVDDSKAAAGVVIISIIALAGLFWLIYGHEATGAGREWAFLPALNASCNAITTVFLLMGIRQIKAGRREAHERSMKSAFLASVIFLLGYLVYHYMHGDSRFLGQGWIRPVYFSLLISHILLSVVALPLVLLTMALAWKGSFANHRRIAKWTFPIWLYVSFTGVTIFFFLRAFGAS